MNIVKATHRFEEWLGRHTTLVKPDPRLKHQQMAAAVFPFLRATFYRWMQIWPEVCPDLAKAPRVLAVGDLHVENSALDPPPLVATLLAHRTERSSYQPRRTPTAFCHGMGDSQCPPGCRGRAAICPPPSQPSQTKLAVRSRQRHGKGGHQRLAHLEKIRGRLIVFFRWQAFCEGRPMTRQNQVRL